MNGRYWKIAWVCGALGVACQSAPAIAPVEMLAPTFVAMLSVEVAPPPPTAAERQQSASLRLRGLEARQAGDFTAAIAAMRAAVALDPTQQSGRVLLGWTLHLDGRTMEAVEVLTAARDRDSKDVPTLNALGIAYLVSGDLDRAIATHSEAIALAPENEIAHYNLSLAFQRQTQFEQAITHAERAIALEPSNPHPLVALAIAQWSRGDVEAARQTYRRAIALDGRYRHRGYLIHLERAGFSARQIQTATHVLQSIATSS
ncbi:tetratricopeptide TPR_4 repeat-containing protein [Rubidibacter lacunae KORDI 51-2]|uniref:Tetratricopeptide TPR_4 repeat-containing protein n=1 Tax=Rubidibacter lacunae KORDI 51-2 TaxID=582515 RepID=U5DL03_9CHRO|nr:tetratricopeptide repeat protein [Rubidibacter lacunae]ERN41572.1 tetratricopeptide TPR_4 repeat-containing protein [Rubidibacter lacunae KORDI 51-2]